MPEANRAFLARVVRYLAGEAGIRQFLDIGTGIPTANNTHEVAQAIAPDSRVVYVDNDPIVLAHARALLTSSPEGVTAYLDADFRDVGTILSDASQTLDFSRPVAIMLIAILHLVDDEEGLHGAVAKLIDAVPSGSYLAISHLSSDIMASAARAEANDRLRELMHERQTLRNREEVASFFTGLEMVTPGLVPITQWRPDSEDEAKSPTALWGGLAQALTAPLHPPGLHPPGNVVTEFRGRRAAATPALVAAHRVRSMHGRLARPDPAQSGPDTVCRDSGTRSPDGGTALGPRARLTCAAVPISRASSVMPVRT